MSDIFKGLANAPVFERGQFLKKDGNYLLEVKRVIHKKTIDKGYAFIVEFNVLEAVGADVTKPGATASWYQAMGKTSIAYGAIKELAYAVLGLQWPEHKDFIQKEVDPKLEDLLVEACSDPAEVPGAKDAWKGQRVCVQTYNKLTKAKTDFTVHKWSPAPDKAAA